MKKLISTVLAFIIMLCIAVPVFAYESKENPGEEYDISVFNTIGGTVRYYTDSEGNVILIATPYENHDFSGWQITGDYTIIEGSIDDLKLKIKPESDIKVIATYDGNTEPVKKWEGNESPKTGYSVIPAVILATVSLFGCAYCVKRSRED